MALAEEYGVQFFETSALTGNNVEGMFTALATTIKRKRIDELENAVGDEASLAGQSQGGTVKLGDGEGAGATGARAKIMGNCC